jgi:hypothetical protein
VTGDRIDRLDVAAETLRRASVEQFANGRLRQGGLSSLDGVHPSAIGHGLLAREFLKVMREAGVIDDIELDWEMIFASDRLYSEPIKIMQEIYEHTWLAEKLLSLIRTFRRSIAQ